MRPSASTATSVALDAIRGDDFDAIVRLAASLGPRYTSDPGDPETRHVFELYERGERKGGLVARTSDGEIVGVYLYDLTPVFSPTNVHGRGDLMAVDPAFRGRGIAREMMAEAWSQAAAEGITSFLAKSSVPEVIAWFRSVPQLDERGVYFYYDPEPARLGKP
jgi:ribosomal protein S18 acetylase RimI-like enzyme